MMTTLKALAVGGAGYLVGAVLGYFAVQLLSTNTHDRAVEAAMTGAFVAGPLLAIVAMAVFIVRRIRASRSANAQVS